MINGFYEETKALTDVEKKMVPVIIKGLWERIGEEKAISAKEICTKMKAAGYKLDQPRLRKIVNFLRGAAIIPNLIATSKGYYRTNDKEKLAEYIESIRQRAGAINAVAENMEKYLHTL